MKMELRFTRLIITLALLKYMTEIPNAGRNPAYTSENFPGIVLMQYVEKGETFFTVLSMKDYQRIKGEYWSGTNQYVTTCRNGKTIYLHRELCPGLQKGQYAHHRGSKFDNRPEMLEAVTPADHDQHRTYCGDLVLDVK
ncbi:hypothetical protein [uncultured Oscillibacter sp.]|uniref:hypothetical protein n=1 Tax=uncultured Oscillibacter sp. TaxID=876091 RepID=UPI0025EB3AD3|nr:hypothetical protein [uncultured Oscillibacter sp.]